MLRQLVLDLHQGAQFERVYEKHYSVLSGPISLTEIFVPLFLHTHQTKLLLKKVVLINQRDITFWVRCSHSSRFLLVSGGVE